MRVTASINVRAEDVDLLTYYGDTKPFYSAWVSISGARICATIPAWEIAKALFPREVAR